MRIKPFFRWYDLWIGVYVWRPARTVFICPLPMIGVRIEWPIPTNYEGLLNLVEDKMRLEKLTDKQLVRECLETANTDLPVVTEMMTRLDPYWTEE